MVPIVEGTCSSWVRYSAWACVARSISLCIEVEDEDEGVMFWLGVWLGFGSCFGFLPPNLPISAWILRTFSSRTMRRQMRAPSSSNEAQPDARILVRVWFHVWLSKPSTRAIASSAIGCPLSRSAPRSSDSCIMQSISNQTPLSKKPRDCTAMSLRQSPG